MRLIHYFNQIQFTNKEYLSKLSTIILANYNIAYEIIVDIFWILLNVIRQESFDGDVQ